MKKAWKKAAALALAAALCLSQTACGDTSYIMKANSITVPAGVYILNEIDAISKAYSHEDFDSELKNVMDNKIEDKSLEVWVQEQAKQSTLEYLAVEQQFAEAKLELTEDELSAATYSSDNMWQFYQENYQKVGIAQSSYTARIENSYKSNALFMKEYGKGGAKEISEADLKKDLKENYAQVDVLTFSTQDEEGTAMTDADKKTVETEAKAYLERAKKGEEMATLIAEKKKADADKTADDTEDAKEDTATEETSVPEVIHNGDASQSGTVSASLSTLIFEKAKEGTPTLLSDDSAYYVVLRDAVVTTDADFEEMRETLAFNIKGDEYKDTLAETAKALTPEINDNTVKTFSVSKLMKDMMG